MSYMRGDLLSRTRKLVKGLAKPTPIWLKAMEEAPPLVFPRCESKIRRIELPEDVYVKRFIKKHPSSLDALRHDPDKISGFDPPPPRVFAWRVVELKEQGVSEAEAMAVAHMEYKAEKKDKKKAYSELKKVNRLQGKKPPPNPYPSAIKENKQEKKYARDRYFVPKILGIGKMLAEVNPDKQADGISYSNPLGGATPGQWNAGRPVGNNNLLNGGNDTGGGGRPEENPDKQADRTSYSNPLDGATPGRWNALGSGGRPVGFSNLLNSGNDTGGGGSTGGWGNSNFPNISNGGNFSGGGGRLGGWGNSNFPNNSNGGNFSGGGVGRLGGWGRSNFPNNSNGGNFSGGGVRPGGGGNSNYLNNSNGGNFSGGGGRSGGWVDSNYPNNSNGGNFSGGGVRPGGGGNSNYLNNSNGENFSGGGGRPGGWVDNNFPNNNSGENGDGGNNNFQR